MEEITAGLYLVGTPIGNLEDLSSRARRVLETAALIGCEDTRVTKKLLGAIGIHTTVTSVRAQNESGAAGRRLVEEAQRTCVAYVSDAGMPGISDPGTSLVQQALQEGVPVRGIPGACAPELALTISGLRTDSYAFLGFLPRSAGKAMKQLRRAASSGVGSLVIFESPRRTVETVKWIAETFGKSVPIAVCRELTKKFETVYRGGADDVMAMLPVPLKGEVTIVVQPRVESVVGSADASKLVLALGTHGVKKSTAAKILRDTLGIQRHDAYELLGEKTDEF